MADGTGYAEQVWPRHADGSEVRFGDIWETEEFGRIPVQKIVFDRNGVYVGDYCGHGRYFAHGDRID